MGFFSEQLGESLFKGNNKREATAEILKAKDHVLMYFSAHWCPPCRRFTPELVKFYNKAADEKRFEIVFVSLDKTKDQFEEYYGTMPWAAVPFDESKIREKVGKKYGGSGIPELVVFDSEGNVVKKGAVGDVREDPSGNTFPWPPPTWDEALGEKFLKQDGNTISVQDALKGKQLIGVYCSAHWCPPCRQFTPVLKDFYKEYKAAGGDDSIEIIFCSSDKAAGEMKSYFNESHGDYLCMPFDSPARVIMKKFIDVPYIPVFAVFTPDGKLVNKNARDKVSGGAEKALAEGWEPPLVCDLSKGELECQGSDINETPSIVVRCGGCDDDEQANILAALTAAAREVKATPPEVLFFTLPAETGPAVQLTSLTAKNGSKRCSAPESEPLVLLFDVPSGGFYESSMTDVTKEGLLQLIKDFKEDKLGAIKAFGS